jgi:cytochrome c553
LRQFRSGARASDPRALMRQLAAKLSDDEMHAVAQYVAALR